MDSENEINAHKSLEEENDSNLLNVKHINQENAETANVKRVDSSGEPCVELFNNVEEKEVNSVILTDTQKDGMREQQDSECDAGHTIQLDLNNQYHSQNVELISSDNNHLDAEVESEDISINKARHPRRFVLDDDNDDDDNVTTTSYKNGRESIVAEGEKKRVTRRLAIIDSDSDEQEKEIQSTHKSGLASQEHVKDVESVNTAGTLKQSEEITLKSVASLPLGINENLENNDDIAQELHRKRLAVLCDSEDSDEEIIPQIRPIETNSKVAPKKKNVKKSAMEEPSAKRVSNIFIINLQSFLA